LERKSIDLLRVRVRGSRIRLILNGTGSPAWHWEELSETAIGRPDWTRVPVAAA